MNVRKLIADDRGFSLSEMMIVLGLMSFVLMGAWGGMYFVTKSNEVSTQQGTAAHDFGDPMEEMSLMIMQNLSIKSAAPNRLEVWTDRDMNGAPELDAFYVTNDKKLVFEKWGYTSDRATVTSHNRWVMSDHNANIAQGVPLFTYYDNTGAVIPEADLATRAPAYAVRVHAGIVVDTGNGTFGRTSRDIAFRNRS